ncbi:MAG TPA: DMT family transporter [Vicinamibacterales bacterium]|nr:DMT family transporter [Vicinamibacterales bacterium]
MRRIDALLVLMVVIWGVNYSIIKSAFAEIPPQPFNAMRLMIASAVFLVAIRMTRGRTGPSSSVFFTANPLTRADEWSLFWLGIVGHLGYQYCFVGGVAETSVSNAALIIGSTPVVVAVASSLLGRERISLHHWVGAAISITGIYFVVGRGASFGGSTLRGDLLIIVSVACWAAYTIGASRLIARHSPLFVTGMTMAIGGVPYVALTFPQFLGLDWARVSVFTWVSLVMSALLALNVAYLVWYTGVQKIGPARTSMYSNLVPLCAMTFAAFWLDEPLSADKLIGAAAVLTGVLLTRLGRKPALVPPEE